MRVTIVRFAIGVVCVTALTAMHRQREFVASPSALSMARSVGTDSGVPAWLFPRPPAATPPVFDTLTLLHVPHTRVTFVEARLHDLFFAPDWYPSSHPAMPDVVLHGRKPALYACGYCHQPDGSGRPENVEIAGLPAAYIVQQVADMKSHTRVSAWTGAPWTPSDNMRKVAEAATDEEVAIAAAYFASLRPRSQTRVVEAARIPRARVIVGIYARDDAGGTEPLANRVIEMPNDFQRHERRDPYVGYIAYVPVGSIARGRALTSKPMNDLGQVCGSCHGPALRGSGVIPPIAGLSPGYVVRQLLAFKAGTRATPASVPMRIVANALSLDDMIAVASYAATLKR